jgi:predicted AAA+ superfamily ATPase
METNFRQIVAEQREELTVYNKIGWVPRDLENAVKTKSRLAQIITGVRRSGKSMLAHRALKGLNYAYVNFDDERLSGIDAARLNDLLEAVYNVYGEFTHLLLDEIQNVEYWHLFVNRLLRKNIHIVLTGSNSKLLGREMATHLTGRYNTIELFPFSFKEFLKIRNIQLAGTETAKDRGILSRNFDEYLLCGGFPEILMGETKTSYIENLFEAIVTRDIIFRYHIRHVRAFRQTAEYLSNNFASELSYNRVKNLFGLGSENTAKNYISYLEEAYLVLTLPKFSFKNQERLRYRKTYIIDNAFSGVTSVKFTSDSGRLLENVIFLELSRRSRTNHFELFYYKKQYEVDFVLYKNLKVLELIQVTLSTQDEKTLKREMRALIHAAKELDMHELTIITLNEQREIREDSHIIKIIPAWKWLLES